MCGIVGAIAERSVIEILMEGLRRLEYRGYDSAGVAVVESSGELHCHKAMGKVAELSQRLEGLDIQGVQGIAHTRWATHGRPSEENAHPHCSDYISVVHNGIVENHEQLRSELVSSGYVFQSETDTEVIAHLMHSEVQSGKNMMAALEATIAKLEGAYALCVLSSEDSENLYVARQGSPLVLGLGIGENYVASDQVALRPVTDRFMFLEDGDYGRVSKNEISIFDKAGEAVKRRSDIISEDIFDAEKGRFKHFMLKEIYEQPDVIRRTVEGHVGSNGILLESFGADLGKTLAQIKAIDIVACGTSYHAGLIAKHWIEEHLNLPVAVEVASEYRYRHVVVPDDALFVTISQSGETADTMAALGKAKELGYAATLAVCNVSSSSLVRESDHCLLTRAGPEIGVASTKAFTTQLTALLLVVAAIGKAKNVAEEMQKEVVAELKALPDICRQLLTLESELKELSYQFADKFNALFLGRGVQYPVAKEGSLKLKEISYIHAEAYPAGELKHGPLALIDSEMPVVAVAPNNDVLEKIKSNLEEVKARGGQLFVFADADAGFEHDESTYVVKVPHVSELVQPIVYSIPLQLLAYYVALVKGTDVDQPRNLAKSVTVE